MQKTFGIINFKKTKRGKTMAKEKKAALTDKNLHKDHRSRMREKVKKYGFRALADHEKLEYLLFYSIPRVNTNPTAHLLLERFGTFSGVLDAPESELLKIEGVGETSVMFLKLLPQVASYYVNSSRDTDKRFDRFADICNHLVESYIGITEERVRLICLDDKNNILFDDFVQEGSVNSVDLNYRKIMQIILSLETSNVIIAHNHPTGVCRPSVDDKTATLILEDQLKPLKVRLHAHVLVAEGKYCIIDTKI